MRGVLDLLVMLMGDLLCAHVTRLVPLLCNNRVFRFSVFILFIYFLLTVSLFLLWKAVSEWDKNFGYNENAYCVCSTAFVLFVVFLFHHDRPIFFFNLILWVAFAWLILRTHRRFLKRQTHKFFFFFFFTQLLEAKLPKNYKKQLMNIYIYCNLDVAFTKYFNWKNSSVYSHIFAIVISNFF